MSARLDQPLLHWLLTLAVRYVGGDDGDDCFDDDDGGGGYWPALAPEVTTSILSKIWTCGHFLGLD